MWYNTGMDKNTLGPKTANINARVEKHLKAKAEKVLRGVGVRTSDAITMFLHQIVLHRGLPFEVRIPTMETRKAIAELDAGRGTRFSGSTLRLLHQLTGKRRE